MLEVIRARHCQRAFLDRAVRRAVLADVLTAAANAPSNRNTQPWQVAVLTGEALRALGARLCSAHDRREPGRHDYPYRLATLDERATARAHASDLGLRRHIPNDLLRENLRFYGAPVALICHLPRDAVPTTFLELGCFLQNVMLGLVASGLGSCPQGSPAGYADIIRSELGLGADRLVVCSLMVGYVDEAAPVNRFYPERASLEEYVQWHG